MELIQSFNLWLTGLPSSGKTTTAIALKEFLKKEKINIIHLDGDIVRRGLNADLGFSEKDREENLRRIIHVSEIIVSAGVPVVTSFISPFAESRAAARSIIPNFIEVYVTTPLEICIDRDVKGLYKKAQSGEIKNMTGVGDTPESRYDIPESPEIKLDTKSYTPAENVDKLIQYLAENNYLE